MRNSSNIKEQFVKNSFWILATSFINRAGGFILILLISRMLMPKGFGIYSLVMTTCLLFISFSNLGINETLIRYLSLEIDKNKEKARAYFKYLLKIKILLTIILSLILLVGAYPISLFAFHDLSLFPYFLILSFYVFITSLTNFFESLFFIRKKVRYISLKESISLSLRIISLILIGAFVISEFRLTYLFICFVAISILTLIFNFHFSKKSYPFLFKKSKKIVNKKKVSIFMFFLNMQNLSRMILSQSTIIILGIFLIKEYVGYYSVSWGLLKGITSLLFSFSYIFIQIFTNSNKEAFSKIFGKIFRLFFIFSLPISFGLSLLSKFFITTIYGYDYLPAHNSLIILAFIIPFLVGLDIVLALFSAKNKLKKISGIILISAIISIILNYLALQWIHSSENAIIAVSMANLISWIICFTFSVLLLKKELHINKIFSSWIIKSIISCLIMSAFLFLSFHFFPNPNLLLGIIIIILSAIIYFIFILLLKGIMLDELIQILKILFKRKKTKNLLT